MVHLGRGNAADLVASRLVASCSIFRGALKSYDASILCAPIIAGVRRSRVRDFYPEMLNVNSARQTHNGILNFGPFNYARRRLSVRRDKHLAR